MNEHSLLLDFALVMGLLLVAPLLSVRLRLPDIFGLMLAGMLFGEWGVGLFSLDATFLLLGTVGLLYLMLLAGLEINLNEFRRSPAPALIFGALTFAIPMLAGTFGARSLLGMSWPQSILMASMFASHTLVPLPTLQRLGLGRNRAVTAAIGGTIFTDTLALLVLVVVVRTQGQNIDDAAQFGFWLRLTVSLVALLFASLYLLPRLGYRFFQRTDPGHPSAFVFVLAATFLASTAAEWAGMEGIIGAFLAGLALSPLIPSHGILMNRLHFVGHALFIPFFLFSVGMRINVPALFRDASGWGVTAFMLVTVILTKWLAAWSGARFLGYTRREAGLIFGLTVNQAAATLAAVLVGVNAGLFDSSVLNGSILMILVSCLLGPWVSEHYGRLEAAAEQASAHPSAPRHESGRILAPLGDPAHAEALMDLAIMIRPDRCRESIYPLHVALDGPNVGAHLAAAESLLARSVARAVAADIPVIPLARIDVNIAAGIVHAAMEFRAGAIVLGWHARRALLHTTHDTMDEVLAQNRPAILLCRPGPPLNSIRRLWVAVPPMIEHHPGIVNAMQLVRRVTRAAGAQTRFLGTPSTLQALQKLPTEKDKGTDAEWTSVGRWQDITAAIREHHQTHDALALIAVRPGRFAWHPSLDRTPSHWARLWPDDNVIVIYPPRPEDNPEDNLDEDTDADVPVDKPRPETSLPPPLVVSTPGGDLGSIMEQMLEALFGKDARPTPAVLASLQRVSPVPIAPDLFLVHTHTPFVVSPRVLVSRGATDAPEPGRVGGHPKTLVMLLSPASGTPAGHLATLASIARAARAGTLLPREGESKT